MSREEIEKILIEGEKKRIEYNSRIERNREFYEKTGICREHNFVDINENKFESMPFYVCEICGINKTNTYKIKKKYNYYVKNGIGIGGRNKERKKFSPEQEQQIISDYFDHDLSRYELKAKWGIQHKTMQSLFAKVIESGEREPKKKGRKWYKEKDNG